MASRDNGCMDSTEPTTQEPDEITQGESVIDEEALRLALAELEARDPAEAAEPGARIADMLSRALDQEEL